MADTTAHDIQAKELNMLLVFKEFCDAHNLRFYLCGGGLIGAIRHKGFIPWDEDWLNFGLYMVINGIPIVGQREIKSIMMRVHQSVMKKRLSSIGTV